MGVTMAEVAYARKEVALISQRTLVLRRRHNNLSNVVKMFALTFILLERTSYRCRLKSFS